MKRKTKAKILLIAGAGELSCAVRERLAGADWELLTAANGAEAAKALGKEKPDLILADVMLPGMERMIENLKRNGIRSGDPLWFRQFMIEPGRHAVYRVQEGIRKEEISLSPKEYAILTVMVRYPREVIAYRQLYRLIWAQEDLGDVRPLMVHVSNLRKKIDGERKKVIRAVRGVGYIFEDV